MALYFGPGLPTAAFCFPAIKRDEALVRDSIVQILGTRQGSRLHQPEFGSRLEELVFEPNDAALRTLVEEMIFEAITRWEPRVDLVGVAVNPDENLLRVSISMVIKRLNIPFDLPLTISRNNI